MKEDTSRGLMAASEDVVERSMSINSRLPAQLEKALERNIVLRIGWTTSGDPVPKNGELGLCPQLPKGARIRSLGTLGPFTAAFGKGEILSIPAIRIAGPAAAAALLRKDSPWEAGTRRCATRHCPATQRDV